MNITVIGTGYVGLVVGVCLSAKGHNVIGLDIDKDKIDKLQNGILPIYEDGLQELLLNNLDANRIKFTVDNNEAFKDADVIYIGVGTPDNKDGSPNMSFINEVVETISCNIRKDIVIVVKSTVPVGTCDSIEKKIREYLNVRDNGDLYNI